MLYDLGFPPQAGKIIFIIGRVVGMAAEVAEEYERERPMRIRIPVEYDGEPPRQDTTSEVVQDASRIDHVHATHHTRRATDVPRPGRTRARGDAWRWKRSIKTAVDRLCRAVAWAGGNETTADRGSPK